MKTWNLWTWLKYRLQMHRMRRMEAKFQPGEWVINESGYSVRVRKIWLNPGIGPQVLCVSRDGDLESCEEGELRTWEEMQADLWFASKPPPLPDDLHRWINKGELPEERPAEGADAYSGKRLREGDWVFSDSMERYRVKRVFKQHGMDYAQLLQTDGSLAFGPARDYRSEADLRADMFFIRRNPNEEA